MKHQIITIADWLGSASRNGVELGPERLREFILSGPLKKYFTDEAMAVLIPKPSPKHLDGKYKKVKYLPEIKQICTKAKDAMIEVMGSGNIPVVLMGNDSSMIGVISAVSKKIGSNYALIWFDAHGDINTPDTTPSGKLYGMPLSHLLGHGNKSLTQLNDGLHSIECKNLVMLGQRALDPGEIEFIRKNRINLYGPKFINSTPAEKIAEEICYSFKSRKITKLFIHIDLDVLDPMESPGVSMHEPEGLHAAKLLELIRELTKKFKNNLGISIGEYNPKKDMNNKTRKIAYEIIRDYV